MNEFDKALEDITFEGEWIGDSYQEDLLANYPEVIEQVKQAIEKHVIGEDELVAWVEQPDGKDVPRKEHQNELRAEQRQKLYGNQISPTPVGKFNCKPAVRIQKKNREE